MICLSLRLLFQPGLNCSFYFQLFLRSTHRSIIGNFLFYVRKIKMISKQTKVYFSKILKTTSGTRCHRGGKMLISPRFISARLTSEEHFLIKPRPAHD